MSRMILRSASQSGVGGLEPDEGREGAMDEKPDFESSLRRRSQHLGLCHAPWRRTNVGFELVVVAMVF